MKANTFLLALPCALLMAGTPALAQTSSGSDGGSGSGDMAKPEDMSMTCEDFALLDVPGRGEVLVRLSNTPPDGSGSDGSGSASSSTGSSSDSGSDTSASTDSASTDTASTGMSDSGSASSSGMSDGGAGKNETTAYVVGAMEYCMGNPSGTMGDASSAGHEAADSMPKSSS